jgi:hypothetical protein
MENRPPEETKTDHKQSRRKQPAFFQCIQLYKSPVQPFYKVSIKLYVYQQKTPVIGFLRPFYSLWY